METRRITISFPFFVITDTDGDLVVAEIADSDCLMAYPTREFAELAIEGKTDDLHAAEVRETEYKDMLKAAIDSGVQFMAWRVLPSDSLTDVMLIDVALEYENE